MVPSNEHQASIVHKQGNNSEISAMPDMIGFCLFLLLTFLDFKPAPPPVTTTSVSKALISLLRAKMRENAKKAGKSFKGGINVKSPTSVKAGGNRAGI